MSDLPAAGWYPDPEYAGQQRYWDGQQWTDHRAPMATGGEPQWPAGQPQARFPAGQNPAAHVDTWLWQSIVATILCCQPPGIVGIVFAAQANAAKNIGDVATAQDKARLARIWTLVAVGIVVGIALVFGAFALVGAIAGSSQSF